MAETSHRVLVVDDEPQIRRFLRATLSSNGYTVLEAETGAEALRRVAADRLDLVVLDLGLPDIDGTEVLRRIREWSSVPLIVLSIRAGESDKVEALDIGADDFVTKPFGVGELLARMRTALRHQLRREVEEPTYRDGPLLVDLARRLVTINGIDVRLTPTEYDLLRVFVLHAGRVLTHQYLLREVWGAAYTGQTHYLRVFVGTLRQKIEPDPSQPRFVITEPGVGYRLHAAE